MSSSWESGSTPQWRRIRARVLRDNQTVTGGRCQLAIPRKCTGHATQVHHVYGRAVTGDDPRYLVATCRACNLAAGEPETNPVSPKRVSRW